MTTIAWDGKTLAADKRATVNGMAHTTKKLIRIKNGPMAGAICGWSNSIAVAMEMIHWLESGADIKEFPAAQRTDEWSPVILITYSQQVFVYEKGPFPIERSFSDAMALGSGREFAMGAMAFGATSQEAIAIATKLDVYTGDGIDFMSHLH